MQPVKITIQGDYLDCQIYSGKLYLWTFDGKLKIYKWYDLVNSLTREVADIIALKFCFLDGNYLYKSGLIELFKDDEFKSILLKKFTFVAENSYEFSADQVDNYLLGVQDTPNKILPTDTEIYSSNLYFINENGLFSSMISDRSKKNPVDPKPLKLWDCNLLSIKASKYPQLALSGGSEGLFELNLSGAKNYEHKEPEHISKMHSSFANYTFWSIYNSSLVDKSYLALFSLTKIKNDDDSQNISGSKPNSFKREYKESINESKIFDVGRNEKFLSWGVDDKIYRATNSGFEIVRFNNKAKKENGEKIFTPIQNVNFHAWKGKVIGGGAAHFGNIVECENALVVAQSDGNYFTIPEPVTRWRIYPRSKNYENHLHVILDDRIEIYSFNHDYFLSQSDKKIGTEVQPDKPFWTSKKSTNSGNSYRGLVDDLDLPF